MADTITGYRQVLGSDPFDVPADVNRGVRHVEDVVTKTVPTPQDLPAAGNWPSRRIWVFSTRCDWQWVDGDWVIAGAWDTGWISLPPASGFVAGSPAPQYRRIGNRMTMQGVLSRSSGNLVNGDLVTTAPFPPSQTNRFIVSLGATGWARLDVTETGQVSAAFVSGAFNHVFVVASWITAVTAPAV